MPVTVHPLPPNPRAGRVTSRIISEPSGPAVTSTEVTFTGLLAEVWGSRRR
jgi:hypothetical protein